ncbi:MAG TPA: hypothetical protein VLH13_00690 [Methanomassiliicoccales archaeon]|nr:hypothetical protein [Methanomassiliicoccales archaeon]
MSYCTTAELVSATGSKYDTATLQALIDRADRQINSKLNAARVSGSGDGIKEASLSLSTSMMLTRMRMDGTKPASLSLGGTLTMSDNIDIAIKELEARAWQLVEEHIAYSSPSRRYYVARSDR